MSPVVQTASVSPVAEEEDEEFGNTAALLEDEEEEDEVGTVIVAAVTEALSMFCVSLIEALFESQELFSATFSPTLTTLFTTAFTFFCILLLESCKGNRAPAAISFAGISIPIAASTPHTDETSIFSPNNTFNGIMISEHIN